MNDVGIGYESCWKRQRYSDLPHLRVDVPRRLRDHAGDLVCADHLNKNNEKTGKEKKK